MRMRILAAAGVLVMLAGTAWAQEPARGRGGRGGGAAPPAIDLTKATKFSGVDLAAAIAKLPTDRPNISTQIFRLTGDRPYTVAVEHRANMPQAPSVHEAEAELFYVIDGSATFTTGGKLPEGGKAIEGGTPMKITKGDFVMVPEGVPHWFSQIDGTALTIMSFHLPRK